MNLTSLETIIFLNDAQFIIVFYGIVCSVVLQTGSNYCYFPCTETGGNGVEFEGAVLQPLVAVCFKRSDGGLIFFITSTNIPLSC